MIFVRNDHGSHIRMSMTFGTTSGIARAALPWTAC